MGLVGIVGQGAISFARRTGFTVESGLRLKTGGKRVGIIAIQAGEIGDGTAGTARIRKQRAHSERAFLARARIERHRPPAGIDRKLKSAQKLLAGLLPIATGSLYGIGPDHTERCPGQGDAQYQRQATGKTPVIEKMCPNAHL